MENALCASGGLLKNLIDNLSGRDGQTWLEILKRVLRRENPFGRPLPRDLGMPYSPWQTISIPSIPSWTPYLEQSARFKADRIEWLDSHGWHVMDKEFFLQDSYRIGREKGWLEHLAITTPEMLGLGKESFALFFDTAMKAGLRPPSRDSALFLPTKADLYPPTQETAIRFGIEPIINPYEDGMSVFGVRSDTGLCFLEPRRCDLQRPINPQTPWIFAIQ